MLDVVLSVAAAALASHSCMALSVARMCLLLQSSFIGVHAVECVSVM
jgi:hypothetical protein